MAGEINSGGEVIVRDKLNIILTFLINKIVKVQSDIDKLHPVGSIIHISRSEDEWNPNNVFPNTTWTLLRGTFLYGAENSQDINTTGGSKDAVVVKHAHDNQPHNHGLEAVKNLTTIEGGSNIMHGYRTYSFAAGTYERRTGPFGSSGSNTAEITSSKIHTHKIPEHNHIVNNGYVSIMEQGESGANKNMPPYKCVNIWERIE